ncbi:MAG: hypothetical protein J6X66_10780 [Lachnospiraceae bacterium]|nr:hypothetical protein [Lachnospiraceae bacterium]
MAINVRSIKCPNCGATVQYDGNTRTIGCEFCGAVLDMTEVYGPKMDRERDDRQDRQINQIMKDMNANGTGRQSMDASKKRKTVFTVFAVIGGIYAGLVLISILTYIVYMGFAMKSAYKSTGNSSSASSKEIDPFDNIEISFYGVSGKATARLYDRNTSVVSQIKKKTSDMENLSNGDTISVTYEENSASQGATTYKLTRTQKTYTVEGLDEYVSDINAVGEDDLEMMKKNAIALAKSECESDFSDYLPGTFELCAIYSLIKKDYSQQNTVFVISFDYDGEAGIGRGYFMAKFSDVTALSTGEYRIRFDPGLYLYSRESYYKGFSLTSAHSSWDAIYTDVYLNNKADWYVYENYKNDELIRD